MSEARGGELVDFLAPFWTQAQAAEALDLTGAELSLLRSAGLIVGVSTADGGVFYPVFQFERHQDGTRVDPGLVPFIASLRGYDGWSVAVLLRLPADELAGMSPCEWVRDGRDSSALVSLARVLAAELGPPRAVALPPFSNSGDH